MSARPRSPRDSGWNPSCPFLVVTVWDPGVLLLAAVSCQLCLRHHMAVCFHVSQPSHVTSPTGGGPTPCDLIVMAAAKALFQSKATFTGTDIRNSTLTFLGATIQTIILCFATQFVPHHRQSILLASHPLPITITPRAGTSLASQ